MVASPAPGAEERPVRPGSTIPPVVEVAQQGHLGPVMDDLTVNMQDEPGHGVIRVRAFGRAAWPGEPFGPERLDALDPGRVAGVQLGERGGSRSGVLERAE